MKGFCIDDQRLISRDEQSGVAAYENIIGAKVKVVSLTMQNNHLWHGKKNELFTIKKIGFRITVDGKCHTIIELEEICNRTFTLRDLEFVELSNG
jgi:hypothetical protein